MPASSSEVQMKTVQIVHGTDTCSLVLLDGAEPSALSSAVAAKFHLGHHAFYLTFPDNDAVVPLTASLPNGLTLILHVCAHRHGHHHDHHHHSYHGSLRSHNHVETDPTVRQRCQMYDNDPPAPPPSIVDTARSMSMGESLPPSHSASVSTEPLLSGSWKVEPGAAASDSSQAIQMVGNEKSRPASDGELGQRLSEILEGDGSKVEQGRATLIVPDLTQPGSLMSLSSYEAHEAAIEATAAIERSAKQIDRFSRVTSELANERTLLAWIRTGLAAIRTVFPFFALIEGTNAWGWHATVVSAQVAMMTVVIFAGISGTWRYEKVKNALRLHDPPQEFGRVSVYWFNGLVAITYVAIGIGIYTMSWHG